MTGGRVADNDRGHLDGASDGLVAQWSVQQSSRALLASLAVLALACGRGGDSPSAPSPVPAPPAASANVFYTAIGASDAYGLGGSVPCAPFTACDNGTGYVQVLARSLRTGRDVTVRNLGLPGAFLSAAVEQISREQGHTSTGNFIDREMPFVPGETTLVTVFGGSNDVNAVTEAAERGAGGSDVKSYLDAQIRAFGGDYDRLVSGVRGRAPNAFIIVMNVPNAAALPYARGYAEVRRRAMQHLSVGFAREANRQAGQGIVVFDLMCDAQAYDSSRFSSDGFHPNDAGYAYLADRLRAIVTGASSSPAGSCSQMTVVPPL
jgi:lysophospholipase L1-like esterase